MVVKLAEVETWKDVRRKMVLNFFLNFYYVCMYVIAVRALKVISVSEQNRKCVIRYC